MGGARIPPHAFTVAPTPPPDIDVAAWERSIADDPRLEARRRSG